MSATPYNLGKTHWKTVKDTVYNVAILPWGAIEAHNYHLPYSTDNIQCDCIAVESARIAWNTGSKVIVLPTIPYGVNTGQLDIKLDININPSTQALILEDIIDSLKQQKIQKLVILNGHGGNHFKQMIREFQPKYSDVFLCTINWYQVLNLTDYFEEPGDHAGETETSLMLHLAPELVLPLSFAGSGDERKFKIKALRERWVWAQREWSKVTVDTGVGNPKMATAEKGKIFFEVLTKKIAEFLIELSSCDVNDLYE